MARMRVLMVFVLAITAGGVLAFGTYNYTQHTPTKTVTIPTKPVVVAAADLDVGATLTREDVKIIDWPANAVPAGAITDPKDAVGRGLILPVIQWEPLLPNPLDKTMPVTRGIQPRALLGYAAPVKTAIARAKVASGGPAKFATTVPVVAPPPDAPTIEIIRGDKRAHEVVRQEQ